MSRIDGRAARRSRRTVAGLGALGVLTVGAVTINGSAARAEAPTDYELLVGASALDMHIADNSLPVTQVVDASPYGTTATLSSSGVVKADAGAPYAPFGYSLPSTVTGVGSGNLPSIPPFPGYVSASYPSNSVEEQKTGGYELSAHTAQRSSAGSVKLGNQQVGSDTSTGFATAQATANDDGTVTTAGTAGASAFSFGDVLDIGRVSSVLSMTRSHTGKPVITGTTDLGTVTVASAFPSGVKDDGLVAFGKPLAVTPSSISAINVALTPYGLALSYLPRTFTYSDGSSSSGEQPDATKVIRSIVSGALQVTATESVPTQGKVNVVYTFGRVTLSETNGGGGDAPGGDVLGTAALGVIPPGPPAAPEPTSGQVAVAPGPTGGAAPPTGDRLTVAPSDSTSGSAPSISTVNLGPGSPRSTQIVLAGRATTNDESSYLMLVLAALGALGAAQLVRSFAVK